MEKQPRRLTSNVSWWDPSISSDCRARFSSEIGFDILNRAHRENLFVMSMTNGSIGYIPVKIAYKQGGYESNSSRFRPGCGEQIADAAVGIIESNEVSSNVKSFSD